MKRTVHVWIDPKTGITASSRTKSTAFNKIVLQCRSRGYSEPKINDVVKSGDFKSYKKK